MTNTQAKQLAVAALETVEVGEPEIVADGTVLFLNADGTYSVCDNGEEVDGLNAAGAERIIIENLTSESLNA